ncbi:molybdopterin converting factor subunit 1 [bacterium]|nr:MAG: molybdopterin converting factor subunit 1 [bacterium]
MKIRVKFFAMCREIAGTDEVTLELPLSATVDLFWNDIINIYPKLEKYKAHSRVALNMEYVSPQALLHEGDEVCIIPPVSGG